MNVDGYWLFNNHLSFVASFCWLNTTWSCYLFCQNHRTNNVITFKRFIIEYYQSNFFPMQRYLPRILCTYENCIQRAKFDWSIGNKATQSASIKLICLHFLETIRKMKWYAIVTHFFSHVKRIEYWFFRMTMSFFGMHKTIIRIATHEFWRISFHKVDGQLFNRSNRCISHNKMKHPNFNIFSICKRKKEQPESVSCQCGRF